MTQVIELKVLVTTDRLGEPMTRITGGGDPPRYYKGARRVVEAVTNEVMVAQLHVLKTADRILKAELAAAKRKRIDEDSV